MTSNTDREVAARRCTHLVRYARPLIVLGIVAAVWTGVGAAQECTGDCNRNHAVEVNELVIGVNIALGTQPIAACQAFAGAAGTVGIPQLVRGVKNALEGCPPALSIMQPSKGMLVLAGTVAAVIDLPAGTDPGSFAAQLDGVDVTDRLTMSGGAAMGELTGVGAGPHTLMASADLDGMPLADAVHFEAAALNNPDECEILNQAHCLLPYPSSRFLTSSLGGGPNHLGLQLPASGMPIQNGMPLDPTPYAALDGFGPAGPILMHFPGGVDLAASNAARLTPPIGTFNGRSLDPDSPTVILDADTGERILHFAELDARAADMPERQLLLLQPGKSLLPGHRYIVAVRHLVHPDGSPVMPETAFAALRDRRTTNIAAINNRKIGFDDIFARLDAAGIAHDDLILAFDFVVQSDASMTRDMLSMRDQAFAWLDAQQTAGEQLFTVTSSQELDCSAPNALFGREVRGSFKVPLFLTSDPILAPTVPALLSRDSDGLPAPNGITNPPFTFAIPCAALQAGGGPLPSVLLGHGAGDTGQANIEGLIAAAGAPFFRFPPLVTGGTDWPGVTAVDELTYIPTIYADLNLEPSFADRVRQGMVNTLILTRLVHRATFNADPAFRAPTGAAVLAAGTETFFAGRSYGGALAGMFGALSPDVERVFAEIPGTITLFADRSSEYPGSASVVNIGDPVEMALAGRLLNDLLAPGDVSGYATHITADPLPETNTKNVLVEMSLGDQEVSTLSVEWLARTMGIPSLVGSVLHDLPQIPDQRGPLASALMVFDIGVFNPDDPAQAPFLPPLENLPPAQCSLCDPHGIPPIFVPDGADLLDGFLTPGGVIANHCNGLCDGAEPAERAYGSATRCDPFHPWFVPYDFCAGS